MNSLQRVIKYCAMAFAAVLAIGIITGIVSMAAAVANVISGGGHDKDLVMDYTKSFTGVEALDIDNATGKLNILTGTEFKVEAKNVDEDFIAEMKNGTLKIRSKHDFWDWLDVTDWFDSDNSGFNPEINLYIPADFIADKAKIKTGAGKVEIQILNTENLVLGAGAGDIRGEGIIAKKVKIDGGVGSISLKSVDFSDVNINCGVGNVDIDGIMTGDNKINCGVGNVELNLIGNADDYNLDIDAGIGDIRLNGDKISKTRRHNSNTEDFLEVDGGVGDLDINFDE